MSIICQVIYEICTKLQAVPTRPLLWKRMSCPNICGEILGITFNPHRSYPLLGWLQKLTFSVAIFSQGTASFPGEDGVS